MHIKHNSTNHNILKQKKQQLKCVLNITQQTTIYINTIKQERKRILNITQ